MDDSMGLCAVDPTFWKGLRGLRGRPDSQNDRFPILKTLIKFLPPKVQPRNNQDRTVLKSTGAGGPPVARNRRRGTSINDGVMQPTLVQCTGHTKP